jgi:hypothetical protein
MHAEEVPVKVRGRYGIEVGEYAELLERIKKFTERISS